ncbi:tRNA-uridine aminocarboxypropyltransferase [Motiliproteus sp. SC1-56]|uniref:tRNA-uridine aminocarboxypropyltransferase n=1 Tax=Motiliproteus sp. SC1-56 TaxID=2799565 RepID=UPI001A8E718E
MSCRQCSLPPSHCACAERPRISSRCEFALLLHPKEQARPTNTGRFLAQSLAGTPCFSWHRTEPDPALAAWLAERPGQTFILFPVDRPELENRRAPRSQFTALRAPRLLLLDGTWKEVRKMLRKSPGLAPFPLLSLEEQTPSRYSLRRGAGADQLCTLESAAQVLRMLGEEPEAQALEAFTAHFCRRYRAFKSSHPPP